jgi:membrane-bound lytic murein transglycosylase B
METQTKGRELTRRRFLRIIAFTPFLALTTDARSWAKTRKRKTRARRDRFRNARELLLEEGFDSTYVDTLFSDRRMKLYPRIKKVMDRPSEALTYDKYRKVVGVDKKTDDGKRFMRKYANELARAEQKYSVDKHYIVAIIGVESDYGRNSGKYNPVGVFVTMIEKIPRRRSFGERELVELLRFCQKYDVDPHSLKGSYSGAIGIAQFLPSVLNKLYVDADGDGKLNPVDFLDAIHSVANYLRNHRGYGSGWTQGTKAMPENKNWCALLAYNSHPNYARAVTEIAEGIHQ